MRFRPLHGRVLVRRLDAEDMTSGGIIIAESDLPGVAEETQPMKRAA